MNGVLSLLKKTALACAVLLALALAPGVPWAAQKGGAKAPAAPAPAAAPAPLPEPPAPVWPEGPAGDAARAFAAGSTLPGRGPSGRNWRKRATARP